MDSVCEQGRHWQVHRAGGLYRGGGPGPYVHDGAIRFLIPSALARASTLALRPRLSINVPDLFFARHPSWGSLFIGEAQVLMQGPFVACVCIGPLACAENVSRLSISAVTIRHASLGHATGRVYPPQVLVYTQAGVHGTYPV